MAIDPSSFHLVNVTDTCAVWNILSSNRLHSAAKEAGCVFRMTQFVAYECLVKPRSSKPLEIQKIESLLTQRLKNEQGQGGFQTQACTIDDLQIIAQLESHKKLGKGELSSIALAKRIKEAVITDDMKARRLAEESGHKPTQTTPHLFSWLIFKQRLGDHDKVRVISEHQEMRGSLAPHFEDAYAQAMQCLLYASRGST